nr:MAG TPA: hypothetical protein [Caudoviricetes sp.]
MLLFPRMIYLQEKELFVRQMNNHYHMERCCRFLIQ